MRLTACVSTRATACITITIACESLSTNSTQTSTRHAKHVCNANNYEVKPDSLARNVSTARQRVATSPMLRQHKPDVESVRPSGGGCPTRLGKDVAPTTPKSGVPPATPKSGVPLEVDIHPYVQRTAPCSVDSRVRTAHPIRKNAYQCAVSSPGNEWVHSSPQRPHPASGWGFGCDAPRCSPIPMALPYSTYKGAPATTLLEALSMASSDATSWIATSPGRPAGPFSR